MDPSDNLPTRATPGVPSAEATRRKALARTPEGIRDMNHDARCDNQDGAIRAVADKADGLAKDLHRDEVAQATLIADLQHLMDRIPEHLGADIARLNGKVDTAVRDLDDLKHMLRADFVTRAELDPIRRLVYGVVGLILTAVIGGLLGLVIVR